MNNLVWNSNENNFFLNIIRSIYEHIGLVTNINTFIEFITYMIPLILFIGGTFHFIYNHLTKQYLKEVLSKSDIKNLKNYVTTYGQSALPTDNSEPDKKINRFNLLVFFIKHVFKQDKHGKYFLILADSGMGKSTFLHMLYLTYKRKLIKKYKIYLYPLTNGVNVEDWEEIKNKRNSILLLDALDEDPYARNNYEKRLLEIISASRSFYKIIITCRVQFFPNEKSEPNDTLLMNYNTRNKKSKFYKIYLSNFNDEDVDTFLKKRFRSQKKKIAQAKNIINNCSDLIARPMILSFIDELLEDSKTYSCISDIYKELIKKWIEREGPNSELLEDFSKSIFRYMFEYNVSYVTTSAISALCEKEKFKIIDPILARTRSLLTRNGKGEYKFAHKSIYEYLISYEAVYNDTSMREKLLHANKNIDLRFYREISYNYLKEGHKELKLLDLTGRDLSGFDLSYADLSQAVLIYAVLINTNLTGATLNGAVLKCAILNKNILNNTNFKNADLYRASLDFTNLAYAASGGAIINQIQLVQ